MGLPSIADQTVYRLRGERDDSGWGEGTWDWSSPDRKKIRRCSFQPVSGEEVVLGRDAVVTRWRFTGPRGADVLSTDRLEYEGDVYEVDGSVTRPRGLGLDHTSALCKRVEG